MATYLNPRGGLQRYDDLGAAHSTGATNYYPDDVLSSVDVLAAYTPHIAAGHRLTFYRSENGQAVVALIADPRIDDALSWLEYNVAARAPMAMEFETAFSGRGRGWFAGVVLGNFADPYEPAIGPIDVVSWMQHNGDFIGGYSGVAGTFLQVGLAAPLPESVHLGDWVGIANARNSAGVVQSNQTLFNCPIRHIDYDRKTIVVGFSDDATLVVSAAVAVQNPPAGSMRVHFFRNLLGATHGLGMRFSGPTPTANAVFTKMAGDVQISGTLGGDQRITTASVSPQPAFGYYGSLETRATSRVRFEHRVDEAAILDCAIDSGAVFTSRMVRTTVKPGATKMLKPRFYLAVPKSISRPVARIAAIEKTGTATAMVTTREPHGLDDGAMVTVKGVMDAVNFPSAASGTPATVIDATHFSVVLGAAATATSWGGSVHVCNGGFDQPNVQAQTIASSATYDPVLDKLRLIGSGTWIVGAGDTVLVTGAIGNGLDPNLDGLWRVGNVSTTNLDLVPIVDVGGARVSPMPVAGTHVVGGSIVLAPSLRIHDVAVEEWTEHRVMIDGAGQGRLDKSIAVQVLNTAAISSSTVISSNGSGGVHVRPAIAALIDIVSAAITASNTSGAMVNDFGNGFQVTFPVTAVSGSTPTLDIRIEESFDGGTNWVPLYEMQRITAAGSYNTPILRASGRYIRYVRTVGGGSPSFTMAATRNTLPLSQAETQKRLMDRSISLTTLNSVTPALFVGAAEAVQLVVNVGAIATTAPTLQLEGSEDGLNWYAIGAPLVGVANSTVELSVADRSPTYLRARVSAAGVGVTPGYVSLKAWS